METAPCLFIKEGMILLYFLNDLFLFDKQEQNIHVKEGSGQHPPLERSGQTKNILGLGSQMASRWLSVNVAS